MSIAASRGGMHDGQSLDVLALELIKGIQPALRTNAKEAIAKFSSAFFANPLPATYEQARFIVFGTENKIGLCRAVGFSNKFTNKLRRASGQALVLLVRLMSSQTNSSSSEIFLSVVQTLDNTLLDAMRLSEHLLHSDLTTQEAVEAFLVLLKQAPNKSQPTQSGMNLVALKDARRVVVNSPNSNPTYYQDPKVNNSYQAPQPVASSLTLASRDDSRNSIASTRASMKSSLVDTNLAVSQRDRRSVRDQANLNTLNDDALELSDEDDISSIGSLGSVSEEEDDDQYDSSYMDGNTTELPQKCMSSRDAYVEKNTIYTISSNDDPNGPPSPTKTLRRTSEPRTPVIQNQGLSVEVPGTPASPLPETTSTQPDTKLPPLKKSDQPSPILPQSPPSTTPTSIKGRFKNFFSRFRSESTQNPKADSSQISTTDASEPGHIYGKSLRDLILAGHCDANCIPKFLRAIMDHIVKDLTKVRTDSIFRLNGDAQIVKQLKAEIDALRPLDLDKWDVHSLTNVVKLWLREMPEPVVPYSLYDPLLSAYESESEDMLFELLDTMPYEDRMLYQYIVTMCVRVSSYQQYNLMTTQNLSIVFAPNIFRSQTPVYSKMVKELPLAIGVLQLSIKAIESSFVRDDRPRQGTILMGDQRSFSALNSGPSRVSTFVPGSVSRTPAAPPTSIQNVGIASEMIVEEMEMEVEDDLDPFSSNFVYTAQASRPSIADMNRANISEFHSIGGKVKPSTSIDTTKNTSSDRARRIPRQNNTLSSDVIAEDDENENENENENEQCLENVNVDVTSCSQSQSTVSAPSSHSRQSNPQPVPSATATNPCLGDSQQFFQPKTSASRSIPTAIPSNNTSSTPCTTGNLSSSPPQGTQYVYAFSGSPTNASSVRVTSSRNQRTLRRTGFTPSSPLATLGIASSIGSQNQGFSLYGGNFSAPQTALPQNQKRSPGTGYNTMPLISNSTSQNQNQTVRPGSHQTLNAAQFQQLQSSSVHSHANDSGMVKVGASGSTHSVMTQTSTLSENENMMLSTSLSSFKNDTEGDHFSEETIGVICPPPPPPVRAESLNSPRAEELLDDEFDEISGVTDPQELGPGWIEFLDPNNVAYYYHPLSNTVSWIRPCFENRKKVQIQPKSR